MAQRLHRIDPNKPAFVPWVSLKEQFGYGYDRIRDFRRVFERTLKLFRGRARLPAPPNASSLTYYMKAAKVVALHARVSTKDKGQDTENQLSQLRTFAATQGWTVAHEYVDPKSISSTCMRFPLAAEKRPC